MHVVLITPAGGSLDARRSHSCTVATHSFLSTSHIHTTPARNSGWTSAAHCMASDRHGYQPQQAAYDSNTLRKVADTESSACCRRNQRRCRCVGNTSIA